jgi:hypothetical protein
VDSERDRAIQEEEEEEEEEGLFKADAVNEEPGDSESDNATSVRCPAVWLTTYDANRL